MQAQPKPFFFIAKLDKCSLIDTADLAFQDLLQEAVHIAALWREPHSSGFHQKKLSRHRELANILKLSTKLMIAAMCIAKNHLMAILINSFPTCSICHQNQDLPHSRTVPGRNSYQLLCQSTGWLRQFAACKAYCTFHSLSVER